jgi:hypothetical protein
MPPPPAPSQPPNVSTTPTPSTACFMRSCPVRHKFQTNALSSVDLPVGKTGWASALPLIDLIFDVAIPSLRTRSHDRTIAQSHEKTRGIGGGHTDDNGLFPDHGILTWDQRQAALDLSVSLSYDAAATPSRSSELSFHQYSTHTWHKN